MIKINLAKNSGQGGKQEGATVTRNMFDMSRMGGGGGGGFGGIVKLLLIVVLPGALYLYGQNEINKKNAKIGELNKKIGTLTTDIERLAPVADILKDYTAERDKNQEIWEKAQKFGKSRNRGISLLDTMQNIIPQKVWITTLASEKENTRLNAIAFSGEEANNFLKAIEAQGHFKDVVLKSTIDEVTPRAILKRMEVNFRMEAP